MQVERRKHVRILTLKNFGWAMGVLLLLLTAANVISEMRGRQKHPGEYGRLFSREAPSTVVVQRPPMVVHEAEVPDVTPAAPPVSLIGESPAPPPVVLSTVSAGESAVAPLRDLRGGVKIVGGPDGVRIEHAATDTAPKLSGGIFRQ